MRTLMCQFPGTARHYAYLYTGSKDVKPGDHAVVHSNGAFSVVEIKGVQFGVEQRVTKPVLAVLTHAELEAYRQQCENIAEYRQAFSELDHLMAEDKKLQKYKDFASETTNPRAQELLAKIAEFSGQSLLPTPTATEDPSPEARVKREDIEAAGRG